MYQLFLRPFTPEGTLKGAEKMLPYLADLGVDILYLCPIVLSDDDPRPEYWSNRQRACGFGNPQNPYRIRDYEAIDPEYGTLEDLRRFVDKAHALRMRVLLDLVYFHCGPNARLLLEHPDFVRRNVQGEVEYTEYRFPMIDFDSPGLREYLYRNMCFFIEACGVDGYRCDCGDLCPISFWEEAKRRITGVNPQAVLLNEGHRREWMERGFDISYGLMWAELLCGIVSGDASVAALKEALSRSQDATPPGKFALRGLENHDIVNDAWENRMERRVPAEAVDAALTINFTVKGMPFLYNGEEIGDTARHSILGNRFYGKTFLINWSNALTPEGKRRMAHVQALAQLRHSHTALGDGQISFLETDHPEQILAFERSDARERLMILANLGAEPREVRLPWQGSGEMLYGARCEAAFHGQAATLRVQGFGYAVLG